MSILLLLHHVFSHISVPFSLNIWPRYSTPSTLFRSWARFCAFSGSKRMSDSSTITSVDCCEHETLWWLFSSVPQSCPTLCNPMDCSVPDFLVLMTVRKSLWVLFCLFVCFCGYFQSATYSLLCSSTCSWHDTFLHLLIQYIAIVWLSISSVFISFTCSSWAEAVFPQEHWIVAQSICSVNVCRTELNQKLEWWKEK